MLSGLVFYLMAAVMVAAATLVVTLRNPVHCVLFLILAFLNGAGLFVLAGAEFLGFLMIVVYVGAVAVLFLFVVMMLDINFAALRQGFLHYLPIGVLVAAILALELVLVVGAWAIEPVAAERVAQPLMQNSEVTNAEALGRLLYTDYLLLFQGAGLVLLVAMIGAIVLTLRHKADVRRQDIVAQTSTRPEDVVEVRKVKPGEGVS